MFSKISDFLKQLNLNIYLWRLKSLLLRKIKLELNYCYMLYYRLYIVIRYDLHFLPSKVFVTQ